MILGTRLWYGFFGPERDDDLALDKQVVAMCRELGDRGKEDAQPHRPKPALAPTPASAPVSASGPTHAPALAAAAPPTSPPTAAPTSVSPTLQASATTASDQMVSAQLLEITAVLREMQAEKQAVIALSDAQVTSLQLRLEALNAAQLLSDEELWALQDSIADFLDESACFDVVTFGNVHTNDATRKVYRLVTLSEKIPTDATFVRQVRRKFV